jgi:hypothetical protein
MEPSNPYQPPVLPTGEGGDMATPIAPGSHLDIHRAIRFFFEDPQWVTKLLMGSLFYLLAFVLIGMVFIAGYMMELIRRSARGERHPLPEWENLGDMFVEGATVLAAYFILVLPAMLLFIGCRRGHSRSRTHGCVLRPAALFSRGSCPDGPRATLFGGLRVF